jgi:large subunit ribosomal protein L2
MKEEKMIKSYKPTSTARRGQTIYKGAGNNVKPIKSVKKKLTVPLKGNVGRAHGKISVHHRMRGAKKRYRIIDYKRNKYNIPGIIESIEYDPNRACEIACVLYADGERRYILSPLGLKVGDKVISGESVPMTMGNALPLKNISVGIPVHNIELYPLAGGKFIRTAGAAGHITAKEKDYINIKMPSGEIRKFLAECFATIGQLSADEWKLIKIGKAGRKHHMGVKPTHRGKASSWKHPLGGSYKRRVGRQPVDKWGNKSKGKKTRKRTNTSKYIVKDRRA